MTNTIPDSVLMQAAHITRERIASAPVEKRLKEEALSDLEQLLQAAAQDVAAVHEFYRSRENEGYPVEAPRATAYQPSDFELRQTSMHAANGSPAVARQFYEFLKEASA